MTSQMSSYPVQVHRSYDLGAVDLLHADVVPDVVPREGEVEGIWLRRMVCDAVIYGLPAVFQYVQLHAAVLRPGARSAFNSFSHETELAGPGYERFKTPNVDTLYSSAWLDLSEGPVEVTIPAMGSRYYTLNFLDAYSNATNLSTRTFGGQGGRVWVVTTTWEGDAPTDVRVFRVATPYVWILLRIFVAAQEPLETVHHLQAGVTLRSLSQTLSADDISWVVAPERAEDLSATHFLQLLDAVLRRNGHPQQEDALVYRFRGLGIGLPEPFESIDRPMSWHTAAHDGYKEAFTLVRSVMGQRGTAAGTGGWRTLSSGSYGFNYLHRAATNYVGLGATTRDESGPYTALVDSDNHTLDGRCGPYRIHFAPPPVDAFWSLTIYDVAERELVANEIDRYAISTTTPGLSWEPDGSLIIDIATNASQARHTWLPAPSAPFYVVLRAYNGRESVVDGSWIPAPVERVLETDL